MNSLTEQAIDDLHAVVETVEHDRTLSCLVISGTGKAFSVGLDKDLLDRAFTDLDYFEHVLAKLASLCTRIEGLDAPVVASVNGLARAGGFELMLACDLAIAAETARIGDVHTTFAVVPGGGSSVRLPRLVGPLRAREIFYSGRFLTAGEAVSLGLVLAAVPDGELAAATQRLVDSVADKSRACLGTVKRQVNRSLGADTASGVAAEHEEFFAYLRAPDSDAIEGFRAWQQQRPPRWAVKS